MLSDSANVTIGRKIKAKGREQGEREGGGEGRQRKEMRSSLAATRLGRARFWWPGANSGTPWYHFR